MVRVLLSLPRALAGPGAADSETAVEATNVGDALRALSVLRPDLASRLRTPDGKVRSSVAVYLRDQDVRELEGEATRLRDGDRLEIVPALAGGQPTEPSTPPLSPAEIARYGRHLVLSEVGPQGQQRLRDSKVLLVGAGGLGSPAALYLAAAGVGELGVVEFDRVGTSNLQRQILYDTPSVGRRKVEVAQERLAALNPGVRVRPFPERLTRANALEIVGSYDVVVDGSDNFPTRYLVNDACVLAHRPDVFGSVYRFEGQVSVFDGRRGPCYRCLFPEPPPPESVPSCADGGVLGVLPGLVGTLQATEAIKLLLGIGTPLVGRLLLVDALDLRFRELTLQKSPTCPVCSERPTLTELIDYEAFCGERSGAADVPTVSTSDLVSEIASDRPPLVLDVRSKEEFELRHIPGARSFPLDQLPDRVSELTSAGEVVVYCNTGVRSGQALRRLSDLGFRRVRRLEGGIEAWGESGAAVGSGPGPD